MVDATANPQPTVSVRSEFREWFGTLGVGAIRDIDNAGVLFTRPHEDTGSSIFDITWNPPPIRGWARGSETHDNANCFFLSEAENEMAF